MAEGLRQQLAGNVRLRIGLALIVAIVGWYLVLDKSEQLNKKQKEYRRISVQLLQARQQSSDTAWPVRNQQAIQALNKARDSDWSDNNFGLIQSRWNDNLQLLLNQQKAVNGTVALSESPADANAGNADSAVKANGIPATIVMKAKLRFEAPPRTLYKILQVIDTNNQSMNVESLTYTWLGSTGRAELNLKALARISVGAAAGEKS